MLSFKSLFFVFATTLLVTLLSASSNGSSSSSTLSPNTGVLPIAASPVPNSIANNATIISNPKCPLIRTTVDLKVHKMTGIWYKTGSYPYFFNEDVKCEYMIIEEVNSNEWNYRVHQYNTSTGQSIDESGTCTINRKSDQQNISATFSTAGVYLVNYRFLKIEYNELALLNACMYRGHEFIGHIAWALTRAQYPTYRQWGTILLYAKEFGLNMRKMKRLSQQTCTQKAS